MAKIKTTTKQIIALVEMRASEQTKKLQTRITDLTTQLEKANEDKLEKELSTLNTDTVSESKSDMTPDEELYNALFNEEGGEDE